MNNPNITWMTPTVREAQFIANLKAAGFDTEPDTEEQLMRRHLMQERETE